MKKLIRPFNILMATFLLLAVNTFAQQDKEDRHEKTKYEFEKKKAVNKSYSVGAADKLEIANSFGSVEIHTWNKNEIKVDVSIEVSANTEAHAQQIIDGISVADKQNGGVVSFKTSIKAVNNNNNKTDKSSMEVNYVISMPVSNGLKLSNEFGATTLPDLKGEVDITSKFGSLTTGALTNVKKIDVEFGKATFGSLTNADVTIKYSKATFDKLVGNIKLNLEFSGASKVSLDNNVTGLEVNASYSKVNIRPVGDPSASYNITTSFGDLKNNTNIKFDSDGDDHSFDHKYSGKSGNGTIPVRVKTSFGKVILGEASSDDMKEKEKDKSKNKSKTA